MELEAPELAYLCAMLGVAAPPGLDVAAVAPAQAAARDSVYAEGLRLLKEHGWLRPAERAGQWRPDEALLAVAATVAQPTHVVLTWRNEPRAFVAHYFDGSMIVELSSPAAGRFRLGMVPDVDGLAARIAALFGAEADEGTRMLIDGATLADAAALSRAGSTLESAASLHRAGADASSERLAHDLAAPGGEIVVGHVRGNEIDAARRIEVYGADARWLATRIGAPEGSMRVETATAKVIARLLQESLAILIG